MHKLIILLFTLPLFSSCNGENTVQIKTSQKQKKVEVEIHETIETFMILRALASEDPLFQYRDSTYKGKPIMYEARKAFAEYKNHKAVIETQKLLNTTSSTGDLILQGLLYFEELPSTSLKYEITSEEWKNRKDTLIQYVHVLHQFYKDAKVNEFILSQADFYEGAIAEANSHLNENLINTMEDYFGIQNHAYKMILIPNSPFGMGFGASVASDDGDIFYQIISPSNDIEWNNRSTYDTYGFSGEGSEAYYRDLVVHEFCHPFITPFLEKQQWKTAISKTDSLYLPQLDSIMSNQGYGSWWGFINEHLVRTAELRIAKKMNEKSLEEMRTYNVKECGFIFIPESEKLMGKYEANRNMYSNIEAFLPELIDQLNTFNKEDVRMKLRQLATN